MSDQANEIPQPGDPWVGAAQLSLGTVTIDESREPTPKPWTQLSIDELLDAVEQRFWLCSGEIVWNVAVALLIAFAIVWAIGWAEANGAFR